MISGDVFGCQVDNGWAGLCGAQLMSPFGSAAATVTLGVVFNSVSSWLPVGQP